MRDLDTALWLACDWLAERSTPFAFAVSLAVAVLVVGAFDGPTP